MSLIYKSKEHTDYMELVSLKDLKKEEKEVLVEELGYKTDGTYVLDKNSNRVLDKYLQIPIKLEKMLIFPGSTVLLDDNEVSINLYIEEYGDVF